MSTRIKTYRASSLPLLMLCGGAQQAPDVRIRYPVQAANDGHAAHELLRGLPEHDRVDWESLPTICKTNDANEKEVRGLVANGVRLWPELRAWFGGGTAESELRLEYTPQPDFGWTDEFDEQHFPHEYAIKLTGHTDCTRFAFVEATIAFAHTIDWKGGRVDTDYRWQMHGYNALVLSNHPEVVTSTATVVWLREREWENYTMQRTELEPWLNRVHDHLVQWNGTYTPGRHCQYCPRSHECPAQTSMMRSSAAIVRRAKLDSLSSLTPDELLELYDAVTQIEQLAARGRECIRNHVVAHGDVIGSTHQLVANPESRRRLDPFKAWPVLEQAGFGDAEFAECVTIRLSDSEAIVRTKAPKRKGKAAVNKLNSALEAAEAITRTEHQRVSKKRR